MYCIKESMMLKFLLLSFYLFSISHCSVMHGDICVKDFSGTADPTILKFGTNIGYEYMYLYCVREIQHSYAYHSLYLSIFLFLK